MYRRQYLPPRPSSSSNTVANSSSGSTSDPASNSASILGPGPHSDSDFDPVRAATRYDVLWRRKTTKKHKTWESDGYALVHDESMSVYGDGRRIATIRLDPECVKTGQIVANANVEVEIGDLILNRPKQMQKISKRDSAYGDPVQKVLKTSNGPAVRTAAPKNESLLGKFRSTSDHRKSLLNSDTIPTSTFIPGQFKPTFKVSRQPASPSCAPNSNQKSTQSSQNGSGGQEASTNEKSSLNISKSRTTTGRFNPPFKTLNNTNHPTESSNASPLSQGSINTGSTALREFKSPLLQKSTPPSGGGTIDGHVLPKLRPHQVDGVEFMRACVLGERHSLGYGCILADDMGLGKTLMAVALIFTLVKQGLIRTALVVCPVSLVGNWRSEFRKWIGEGRLGVLECQQDVDATLFFRDPAHRTYQVMVVGYERMRLVALQNIAGNTFDLVICDEGHRLKAAGSRIASAISDMAGDKRVILTGTPVQNTLDEFWALAEFVNPGGLSSLSQFSRRFAGPIAAGKAPQAPKEVVDLGHERTAELSELTSQFLLRRDHTVLDQYLGVPKSEYVVFCRPTREQLQHYISLVMSTDVQACFSGGGDVLRAISVLKQAATSLNIGQHNPLDRPRRMPFEASGGKLQMLAYLLREIRRNTDEKVVVVSGSTKVLDLCQEFCGTNRMQWLRLDGQTPPERRQGIVSTFNRTSAARAFVFLLSTRSGGTGLNLIGASRLVLVDCDWNPAVDHQAMARIHRDGQTRPVNIYRLVSTGLIDEKIFQRQLTKLGLTDSVLDASNDRSEFTAAQLRDLFLVTEPKKCSTLDLSTARDYIEDAGDDVLEAASVTSGNVSCILRRK